MRVMIRPMEKQDEAFIFSTWLKNYKEASSFAKRIRNDIYFEKHHAIITHILKKPETKVMIAHSSLDHDQIFGFLVFEDGASGQVVHYTFVKSAFQRHGIAKKLLIDSGVETDRLTFTHFTYALNDILFNHQDWIYDPYRI